MQTAELYEIYKRYPSVQTDTRKLKSGDLFFALKGDNFNGNKFAAAALEAGAAYAVIDEEAYHTGERTILVPDALKALQDLSGYHRAQFDIPFIAITGSNGKTTTKELIHAVLSSSFKTYTTEGNLNNHIGVPLTLLKIRPDAQFAIVEMGANHLEEIASYCVYANPTHGLITNVGKAHLEGFGGPEGVLRGKGELFAHLRSRQHGFAFVNWDYEYLHELSKGISGIIKYGTGSDVHVSGHVTKNDPLLEVGFSIGFTGKPIQTKLVGEYNLPNILAAVTIAQYFEVGEDKIRQALEEYEPSNSRSQLVKVGSNQIILDAYNANPSSMKLAIENFSNVDATDKVLVLGAMAELGEHSLDEHRQVLELIGKYNWKDVALVGGDFLKIDHGYHSFADSEQARQWYLGQQFTNTFVLVKGSRSTKMERVVAA
ncbi:MAG: UDP-N-acetylmuramoyl-tripeptide--D-alanyl-D-alanine ligase [Chitinophagaceae bacterium]|nr:MAG: UDP-N-acetylmuramoyl-tripeptide--D-alanyl-D-alanine ligase [Chitinophagaceae bacterium]